MSVSYAGEHRSPSAPSPAPVLAKGMSGALEHPVILASSPSHTASTPPSAPVLAPPVVSPIVQAVERRLRESSYYYLRSIRCAFEAGVITLRGRVPTFYLKQTVQAIVEKIDGVEQVVNLVEVFDSRQAPVSRIRPAS
jgi:BON domain-containing protein